MNYNQLEIFLEESVHLLPDIEEQIDDSFTISGYPHYEDVISNWFAFFLQTDKDHNFGNLFGEALYECLQAKKIDADFEWLLGDLYTERELITSKGGYIDIVVYNNGDPSSNTFQNCLIIEHKVNAGLYNDLKDYYKSIKVEESKSAIILSAKERNDRDHNFYNVSYKELLNKLRQLLGKYQPKANYKYILYLTDLINNMERLSDNMTVEEIKFCFEHGKQIKEILKLKTQAESKLIDQVSQALLESPYRYNRRYPYSFSIRTENELVSLVFDIQTIFSEGKSEFQYWLRDGLVEAWNKVEDFSSLKTYCAEHELTYRKKKQGKNWAEVARGEFIYQSKKENFQDFGIQLLAFLENTISPLTAKVKSLIDNSKPTS